MHTPFKSVIMMATSLLLAAGAAFAASDYLLRIEDAKGESATGGAPGTIEVQSFSWGTSNPTSVGSSGMSSGKPVKPGAAPAAVAAPRELGTGQASGKIVAAAGVDAVGAPAAPAAGASRTVHVEMRESPTLASSALVSACATGKHLAAVTLTGQGRTITMEDVAVTSCTVEGARRKGELTGHVTLIK